MTKKLEDLLNLPDSKELHKKENKKEKSNTIVESEKSFRELAEYDKIAAALPAVNGLGQMADDELNDIANKALTAYDDLMNFLC